MTTDAFPFSWISKKTADHLSLSGWSFTGPFCSCPEATYLINIAGTQAVNRLLLNSNEMHLCLSSRLMKMHIYMCCEPSISPRCLHRGDNATSALRLLSFSVDGEEAEGEIWPKTASIFTWKCR